VLEYCQNYVLDKKDVFELDSHIYMSNMGTHLLRGMTKLHRLVIIVDWLPALNKQLGQVYRCRLLFPLPLTIKLLRVELTVRIGVDLDIPKEIKCDNVVQWMESKTVGNTQYEVNS